MSMNKINQSVLQYTATMNRPYTLNEIQEKLGGEHGKAPLQRSLNHLIEAGSLIEKIYGKLKIFCPAIPDENRDPSVIQAEQRKLNNEISQFEQKLKNAKNTLRTMEMESKTAGPTRTLEMVNAENAELKQKIFNAEVKLKRLETQPKPKPADPAAKKEVDKKYEKYLAAYKKRKRMCKEMIDTIMEGYPGTRKKLVDDISIETDEDVGFVLPDALNTSSV